MLAFGELTSFEQFAADARIAPSVADKVDLALAAGHSLDHYRALAGRITELGADSVERMRGVGATFAVFGERTQPGDWYESLMKGYVLDGIMKDFYRASLTNLDDTSERVATAALDDTRQAEFLRSRLERAIAEDGSALSSRLALWGRRLVAEAMTRGRSILLSEIGAPEATVVAVTESCLSNHSRRMSGLGLVA